MHNCNEKDFKYNKCSCCGKFRKEDDLVAMEGDSSEGWSDLWLECKYCCSPVDREMYFKEKDEEEYDETRYSRK